MAIENEFVANPVTVIDKEVSWFGQPTSGACFIAEGKPLQVWCRPVVRFVGKHCAKSLYSFLEMNSTIDMDDQKNDQGTYDTFGAYVRGELKCEECGKPLTLKKGKSGKFFLVCSDLKCRTFVWIEPKMVDIAFNPEIIRNEDVVWIQNNCISHPQYWAIVRNCKQAGVQMRYFGFASAEKCAEQLVTEDLK